MFAICRKRRLAERGFMSCLRQQRRVYLLSLVNGMCVSFLRYLLISPSSSLSLSLSLALALVMSLTSTRARVIKNPEGNVDRCVICVV
jgi:hypothetical protein